MRRAEYRKAYCIMRVRKAGKVVAASFRQARQKLEGILSGEQSLMPEDFAQKTAQVSRMFARIVPTYDLVNRIMAVGQDQAWRRLAVTWAAPPPEGTALDVATGTGDLALALAQQTRCVVGVDVCGAMLAPAGVKVRKGKCAGRIRFTLADAVALPFCAASFDCVTVAFGVRNLPDPLAAFREMRRVVKPGGRVVCLEIMPPSKRFLGRCYQFYLTRLIPLLGGWISGDHAAYRYLSASVMGFPSAQELKELMDAAGFSSVTYHTLNFETIAIHVGTR